MQKLVFSETPVKRGQKKTILPQPAVNHQLIHYQDEAVLAIPYDSVASIDQLTDLTVYFDPTKSELYLPNKIILPENI